MRPSFQRAMAMAVARMRRRVGAKPWNSPVWVAVKEKRGEKTRVYVGVSDNRSKPMEALPAAPVLEVRAFTHLGRKCQ